MITRNPKKILVADDSLFFRIKLSDILGEAGHLVSVAQNGVEVIEELEHSPHGVDLLILDLQMPEIDGFGVLEWIRANRYEGRFPVLALTGAYEATAVLERLKSLGAAGFMPKKLSPEEVVFRVNSTLFPDERRRGPDKERVCSSIPADFGAQGRVYTGFMLNLSEGGAFLHTKVRLEDGAECEFRFSLPGSDKVIEARGTVRWASDKAGNKEIFCGYGVEFTLMSEEDRSKLQVFVIEERARARSMSSEPAPR